MSLIKELFPFIFQDYLCHDDVDAFVIVYSVSDSDSFKYAENLLADIRRDLSRQATVILAANKADIVRNRIVEDSGIV